MNINEAVNLLQSYKDYKFVARLAPPMLWIAINMEFEHGRMGFILKLTEGYGTKKSPLKPRNPENFRAGRLSKNDEGEISQTGISVDFPASSPSETEFKVLINGEVEIFS